MSMDAPPTPVSPIMASVEKKEKKRKREKDPEKSAKKQKRDTTDTRVEDEREEGRAENKKRRKEKKSKLHGGAQVDGAWIATAQEPDPSVPWTDSDSTAKDAQAISRSNAEKLQKHPPFIHWTASLYLPLSPCAANFPLEGLLAEHVSPLLLTYYPLLEGVLLSYSNARLSEHAQADSKADDRMVLSQCINEYAVTFVWLTADFLLFRPRRGTWMEGYVRLGNESMIGLVCYNYFNAVIEREKMPQEWTWVAEEEDSEIEEQKGRRRDVVESAGFFRDGQGKRVDGRLVFRVEDFDALQGDGGGSVSIMGTLLPE